MGPRKKCIAILSTLVILFMYHADAATPVGGNSTNTGEVKEDPSVPATIEKSSAQIVEILLSAFGKIVNDFIPCMIKQSGFANCVKTIEVSGLSDVIKNLIDMIPDKAIAQPIKFGMKYTVTFASSRVAAMLRNNNNNSTQTK